MPKPSTAFTWATDATFVAPGEDWDGEANKVAPTAGRRAEGYEPNMRVPADELNDILNDIGEWITWLDLEEFTNSSFETLEVGTSLTGIAGSTLPIPAAVAADGPYYHEVADTLAIPTCDIIDLVGSHTRGAGNIILAASTSELQVPIRLPVGCQIIGWRVYVQKNTSGTAEIEAQVHTQASNSLVPAGVGDTASNSANAPGMVTIAPAAAQAIDINPLNQYWLKITPSGSVAPAADRMLHVEIDYTRPAP